MFPTQIVNRLQLALRCLPENLSSATSTVKAKSPKREPLSEKKPRFSTVPGEGREDDGKESGEIQKEL